MMMLVVLGAVVSQIFARGPHACWRLVCEAREYGHRAH